MLILHKENLSTGSSFKTHEASNPCMHLPPREGSSPQSRCYPVFQLSHYYCRLVFSLLIHSYLILLDASQAIKILTKASNPPPLSLLIKDEGGIFVGDIEVLLWTLRACCFLVALALHRWSLIGCERKKEEEGFERKKRQLLVIFFLLFFFSFMIGFNTML